MIARLLTRREKDLLIQALKMAALETDSAMANAGNAGNQIVMVRLQREYLRLAADLASKLVHVTIHRG